MKVKERLMPDLEEEILFLLSVKQHSLSTLAIADYVLKKVNKFVSLARIHQTLLRMDSNGLICITIVQGKKNYKITTAGLAALQTDWDYHSRNLFTS